MTELSEPTARDHWAEWAQMVSGLAHEIKNPLSTISLNLKLLAESLAEYPDEAHARLVRRLGRVQEETERVEQILGDFLRYAGHYEHTPQRTDLCEVVEELRDFFAPQADAAGVVMRAQIPDRPIQAQLDAKLLKQALLNLLINAVQAMDGGGELLMRVSRDGDAGCVEVIDTGPGMDAETLGNVFSPYWSTKKNGTGLGLPTARRIVREHGGTLDVQSEPGQGTRFVVTLPIEPEAAS